MRVSLASRLPLLERWLLKGHISITEIVESFSMTRSLGHAAALLGIEGHPSLRHDRFQKRGSSTKLHPVLSKAVYNCSLESMYQSRKHATAADQKRKRTSALAEAQVVGPGGKPLPTAYTDVERRAMHEHMIKVLVPNSVYSCTRSVVSMESLSFVLGEPAPKLARQTPKGLLRSLLMAMVMMLITPALPMLSAA